MFPSRTNGTLADSDVAEAVETVDAAVAPDPPPDVAFGEEVPLFPPLAHAAEEFGVGSVDDPCRMSVMYCLTNLM